MEKQEAQRKIEELRQHLMDEAKRALDEGDRERYRELQQGEIGLDNLERVL